MISRQGDERKGGLLINYCATDRKTSLHRFDAWQARISWSLMLLYEEWGSRLLNLFGMVNQIFAETRSETAGRWLSFNVLRQSGPWKSGWSEGQSLYLRTPASNPLCGIPTRAAGFSLDFANITTAITIKLRGPDPKNITVGRKHHARTRGVLFRLLNRACDRWVRQAKKCRLNVFCFCTAHIGCDAKSVNYD